MRSSFSRGEEKIASNATVAFRNGSLQGRLTSSSPARALGLVHGPMSGFDNAKVDAGLLSRTGVEIQLPSGNLGKGRPGQGLRAARG
jgi:3-hydroxypropanoate dehydrogenase